MSQRGRQTKLTPVLESAISTAVAAGVPFPKACVLAGISAFTGLEWLRRGEARDADRPPTPRYAQFAHAIARARAHDEAQRIARINAAGRGGAVLYEKTTTYPDGRVITEVRRSEPSWQADAFHLERAYPDRWGRKDRRDLSLTMQQVAAKVAAELGMSPEAVLAEAQALLREVDPGQS